MPSCSLATSASAGSEHAQPLVTVVCSHGHLHSCTGATCACRLFEASCPVLEALKNNGFKFEVVPGMNGRVWLDSTHLFHTIAIANAITLSEFMTGEEAKETARKLSNMVVS